MIRTEFLFPCSSYDNADKQAINKQKRTVEVVIRVQSKACPGVQTMQWRKARSSKGHFSRDVSESMKRALKMPGERCSGERKQQLERNDCAFEEQEGSLRAGQHPCWGRAGRGSELQAGGSRLTITELLQTLHERSCLKIMANRKDSSGVRDGYWYSGGAYFPPFDQWLMLPHILESNRTTCLFK